jgi:hypothetical protein
VLAVGLSVLLAMSLVVTAGASSHREAPMITEDPVADNTDVYAFVAPDAPDDVTFISNWIPFEEPAGGPNFHKFGNDVLYTINIDNDGDAVADIVYEYRFRTLTRNPDTFLYNTGPITSLDDDTWNRPQLYTVTKVEDGDRTVLGRDLFTTPANVGPRSTPDYEALVDEALAQGELSDGSRVFAGPRDEAFPVDLGSIFDLLGLRPFNEAHIIPLDAADGVNTTDGYNVHSIAMQVPMDDVVADDPVIGVWSETYRNKVRVYTGNDGANLRHAGPWVQVSRLGNPLVNEVVIPLEDKDNFNASKPADDGQFLEYVQDTDLDNLVADLYGPSGAFDCFPDVDEPRDDLVSIFLTGIDGLNQPEDVTPSEQLRLNTAIEPTPYGEQERLGVLNGSFPDDADLAGFPNGRRPIDDVVDIELQAIVGASPLGACADESPNNQLGDGVDFNADKGYLETFPYLPTPHSGYESQTDNGS